MLHESVFDQDIYPTDLADRVNDLNDDCDIDFFVSPEYFANGVNVTFKKFLARSTSFSNSDTRERTKKSLVEAIGDQPEFYQRRVQIQSADHTMHSVAQNLQSFMCDEILEKENVNYPVWLLKQKEQITDIKNQLLESIGITHNKEEHHDRLVKIEHNKVKITSTATPRAVKKMNFADAYLAVPVEDKCVKIISTLQWDQKNDFPFKSVGEG
jgi:hypothetical protein